MVTPFKKRHSDDAVPGLLAALLAAVLFWSVVTLVVLLYSAAASAQTVAVTLKGYLVLKKDGVTISQHNTERDAVERALNEGIGVYRIVQPEIEVRVKAPIGVQGMSCFGHVGKPVCVPVVTASVSDATRR